MGTLLRVLFPLIAYFCVATVITLAAGYGYLRKNGALNDENMFQIVALLHGVDLEEIAAANQTDQQDVPPEEMSFEDRQQHLLMAVLHLQTKKDDIEKNITEFIAQANVLDNKVRHYEKFRDEVKEFLDQRKLDALDSGLVGVRKQWEKLDVKQSKQMLVQMVNDDQMDVVIELLNSMSSKKSINILKTFDPDDADDIKMLYQIQQQMLEGGPEAKFIDQKLNDLSQQQN